MTTEELKAVKPQALRLKQVAKGLKVGKVLGPRVLIRPVVPRTELDDANDRLKEGGKGLIVIPDSAKDNVIPRASTGFIIQVGDALERNEVLKPGVAVLFHSLAGGDYKIENESLKLLDEREILCTLEAVSGDINDIVGADEAA